MADDDRKYAVYQSSPPGPSWSPNLHVYPHSHHNTPAQEWSGFNFGSMEPGAFSNHAVAPQRQVHQQLQPLVMPQWPSMLGSSHQSTHQQPVYQPMYQPVYLPPVQPNQPMSVGQAQTPVSATSSRSATATTPRKTLTDQDRKRMCQYAEDHPNSKQTEIGGESPSDPTCDSR
nr:hypothetical protein CFP56_65220 [Quercus suber]